MIVSPGAKINFGLYITGKRPDGYHDLVTLFYPIEFSDSLEVIPVPVAPERSPVTAWSDKLAPKNAAPAPAQIPGLSLQYSCSGIPVKGPLQDNLCIKAYRIMKSDYPELASMAMHLHKKVPMGAGLGGGSADGAAAIKIFNKLGELQLSEEKLLAYAALLGSDCPFFIKNSPQIATGKGEILSSVALSLRGYTLLLVCPDIHVPTAMAFRDITPQRGPTAATLAQIIAEGPQNWKGNLKNQFEDSVFRQFPAIKKIKQDLYELGAVYAAMTGSGSSVFGIFKSELLPAAETLKPFAHYFIGQWPL